METAESQSDGVCPPQARSPFDLCRRRFTPAGPVNEIVIPDEVAAALRELRLLDTDCERLVFRIRAHNNGAIILAATDDDVDELIGFVAAEANHETNRRRQRRLDAALDALNTAARIPDGR